MLWLLMDVAAMFSLPTRYDRKSMYETNATLYATQLSDVTVALPLLLCVNGQFSLSSAQPRRKGLLVLPKLTTHHCLLAILLY
jgi:hypothetical protein